MISPAAIRPALVWALAFLALAASGCADVTDVNRRILVYAIGLDRGEDEQVQLTIQYLLTSGGQQSGGGDGGSPPLQTAPVNHTVSAPTVALALDQIIHQIPGELFLGNLRILAIGRELAEEGIARALDPIMRLPFAPASALAVIAEGTAKEALEPTDQTAPAPGLFMARVMEGAMRRHGHASQTPLFRLYNQVHTPHRTLLVPVIGRAEHGPSIKGIGILAGDRLAWIEPAGTDADLLVAVGGGSPRIPIGASELKDPYVLRFRSLQIRPELDPSGDRARVRTAGTAYLEEGPGAVLSGGGAEWLKREAEDELSRRTEAFITALYAEGIDVLNIGELARRRRTDFDAAEWRRRLPQLRFEFETRVTLMHGLRGR